MAKYTQITKFQKSKTISFPDFDLKYLGTKDIATRYDGKLPFRVFLIKSNAETAEVLWSPGHGKISPSEFKIAGKDFLLELGYSDQFDKKLEKNELIVLSLSP
jgi:hypothetical protein